MGNSGGTHTPAKTSENIEASVVTVREHSPSSKTLLPDETPKCVEVPRHVEGLSVPAVSKNIAPFLEEVCATSQCNNGSTVS